MGRLMNRGDVVICVLNGDYGKPRPAIIVQSDLFNPTHGSITVCPITSYLIDAPLFRITLIPNESNGLISQSQIMVDKVVSIKSERITQKIGELSFDEVLRLNNSLKLWLNLK
jgi:mRNA interferase MazF